VEKHVNVVIPPLKQAFTYSVSEKQSSEIKVGDRVEVPFGRRRASGFVISQSLVSNSDSAKTSYEIKQLDAESNAHSCFRPSDLHFYNWIADYYGASLADVIDVAVPHSVPKKTLKFVHVIKKSADFNPRSKLQKNIFEFISNSESNVDYRRILGQFPGASSALKKLKQEGLIDILEEEQSLEVNLTGTIPDWTKKTISLNEDQTAATKRIDESVLSSKSDIFLYTA